MKITYKHYNRARWILTKADSESAKRTKDKRASEQGKDKDTFEADCISLLKKAKNEFIKKDYGQKFLVKKMTHEHYEAILQASMLLHIKP